MSEEKFVRLDIAFRLPENVAKTAMKLSKEITEKDDVYFVLDDVAYFSHITIFMGEFPEKNLEKIVQAVGELARKIPSAEMMFTGNKSHLGWLGPCFYYSDNIRKIHETIIEKINPLREGRVREKHKTSEYLEKLSFQQCENVEKYGYPNLMDIYEPHLTLTKLKNETAAQKVADEITTKWDINKFKTDTIGIFVLGEHGTCRKLIREFKLG